MTDGACLTGHAAAGDSDNQVNLAQHVGSDQRLTNQQLQGLQTEVIVDVTAVDGDGTGAAFINTDSGDGGLPTAGALLILSLALVHS